MKLFSFLKSIRKDKENTSVDTDEYIPSFWDDDYCQIEIVPKENKPFILKQASQIDDFSETTRTESGFTDIFVRGEMPTTTLSKKIRLDYLEKTLLSFKFEKAKHIYFDGRRILDCDNGDTKAFGFLGFTIFCDIDGEFVKNIWLHVELIASTAQLDLIKNALYTLGEECEVVLIDWNTSKLFDLANRTAVQKYLMQSFNSNSR